MENSTEMDKIFERIFASQEKRKENITHDSEKNQAFETMTKEFESLTIPENVKEEPAKQPKSPAEPVVTPKESKPSFYFENPNESKESTPEPKETAKKSKKVEKPQKDAYDEICENFITETKKGVSEMPDLSPENITILEKFVEDYVNTPIKKSAEKEAAEKQARKQRLDIITSILGTERCKAFYYKDPNSINYRGKAFGVSVFEDDDSLLPIELACTIRAFIPENHIVPIECRDYVNPHQFPVKLEEPERNFFVLAKDNPAAYDANHNYILIQDNAYLILVKNENSRVSAHFYQK